MFLIIFDVHYKNILFTYMNVYVVVFNKWQFSPGMQSFLRLGRIKYRINTGKILLISFLMQQSYRKESYFYNWLKSNKF